MNFQRTLAASAAMISCVFAVSAEAATLFSDTSAPVARADDTSFSATFDSLGAGLGNLSFVVNGFRSLDGQNGYEDDFSLALNGATIFSGTFNLGGGGTDAVFLADPGASVNNVSGNGTAVTWTGGQVNIATPLDLAAGSNTLTFAYHSLTDGHAGFQPTSDEAWDASNIVVTQTGLSADPTALVPEPASWGLMMVGFGGAGAMLRRQRRGGPLSRSRLRLSRWPG